MAEDSRDPIQLELALPAALIEEIDRRAGAERAAYIEAAIRDKFRTDDLDRAIDDAIANPSDNVPEWATAESAYALVREQRRLA